jgi:nucleoside-diphosphate-sugar epimerase
LENCDTFREPSLRSKVNPERSCASVTVAQGNNMKLIVTGATGLLGTWVIRESLQNPKITSVIALARRPVSAPENAGDGFDTSKLKSLVLEDFTNYPEDVKSQLADADACIW